LQLTYRVWFEYHVLVFLFHGPYFMDIPLKREWG
jgi:hypothetical protein